MPHINPSDLSTPNSIVGGVSIFNCEVFFNLAANGLSLDEGRADPELLSLANNQAMRKVSLSDLYMPLFSSDTESSEQETSLFIDEQSAQAEHCGGVQSVSSDLSADPDLALFHQPPREIATAQDTKHLSAQDHEATECSPLFKTMLKADLDEAPMYSDTSLDAHEVARYSIKDLELSDDGSYVLALQSVVGAQACPVVFSALNDLHMEHRTPQLQHSTYEDAIANARFECVFEDIPQDHRDISLTHDLHLSFKDFVERYSPVFMSDLGHCEHASSSRHVVAGYSFVEAQLLDALLDEGRDLSGYSFELKHEHVTNATTPSHPLLSVLGFEQTYAHSNVSYPDLTLCLNHSHDAFGLVDRVLLSSVSDDAKSFSVDSQIVGFEVIEDINGVVPKCLDRVTPDSNCSISASERDEALDSGIFSNEPGSIADLVSGVVGLSLDNAKSNEPLKNHSNVNNVLGDKPANVNNYRNPLVARGAASCGFELGDRNGGFIGSSAWDSYSCIDTYSSTLELSADSATSVLLIIPLVRSVTAGGAALVGRDDDLDEHLAKSIQVRAWLSADGEPHESKQDQLKRELKALSATVELDKRASPSTANEDRPTQPVILAGVSEITSDEAASKAWGYSQVEKPPDGGVDVTKLILQEMQDELALQEPILKPQQVGKKDMAQGLGLGAWRKEMATAHQSELTTPQSEPPPESRPTPGEEVSPHQGPEPETETEDTKEEGLCKSAFNNLLTISQHCAGDGLGHQDKSVTFSECQALYGYNLTNLLVTSTNRLRRLADICSIGPGEQSIPERPRYFEKPNMSWAVMPVEKERSSVEEIRVSVLEEFIQSLLKEALNNMEQNVQNMNIQASNEDLAFMSENERMHVCGARYNDEVQTTAFAKADPDDDGIVPWLEPEEKTNAYTLSERAASVCRPEASACDGARSVGAKSVLHSAVLALSNANAYTDLEDESPCFGMAIFNQAPNPSMNNNYQGAPMQNPMPYSANPNGMMPNQMNRDPYAKAPGFNRSGPYNMPRQPMMQSQGSRANGSKWNAPNNQQGMAPSAQNYYQGQNQNARMAQRPYTNMAPAQNQNACMRQPNGAMPQNNSSMRQANGPMQQPNAMNQRPAPVATAAPTQGAAYGQANPYASMRQTNPGNYMPQAQHYDCTGSYSVNSQLKEPMQNTNGQGSWSYANNGSVRPMPNQANASAVVPPRPMHNEPVAAPVKTYEVQTAKPSEASAASDTSGCASAKEGCESKPTLRHLHTGLAATLTAHYKALADAKRAKQMNSLNALAAIVTNVGVDPNAVGIEIPEPAKPEANSSNQGASAANAATPAASAPAQAPSAEATLAHSATQAAAASSALAVQAASAPVGAGDVQAQVAVQEQSAALAVVAQASPVAEQAKSAEAKVAAPVPQAPIAKDLQSVETAAAQASAVAEDLKAADSEVAPVDTEPGEKAEVDAAASVGLEAAAKAEPKETDAVSKAHEAQAKASEGRSVESLLGKSEEGLSKEVADGAAASGAVADEGTVGLIGEVKKKAQLIDCNTAFGLVDGNLPVVRVPYHASECMTNVPLINHAYVFEANLLKSILMFLDKPGQDSLYLSGPSGCGKTSAVIEIAARLHWPLESVTLSQRTEVADLIGRNILRNGELTYEYGPLAKAMIYGEILLLNEIDLLAPGELAALNDVLEGKTLTVVGNGGEKLYPNEGFRIIATANTKGFGDDTGFYQGVRSQNQAFLDRWHFVECNYSSNVHEMAMITSTYPTINQDFVKLLVRWANVLRYGTDTVRNGVRNSVLHAFMTYDRVLSEAGGDKDKVCDLLSENLPDIAEALRSASSNEEDELAQVKKQDDAEYLKLLRSKGGPSKVKAKGKKNSKAKDESEDSSSDAEELEALAKQEEEKQLAENLVKRALSMALNQNASLAISQLSAPLSGRSLLRISRFYAEYPEMCVQECIDAGFASRLPADEYEFVLRLSYDVFGYGSGFNELPHNVEMNESYYALRSKYPAVERALRNLEGNDIEHKPKADSDSAVENEAELDAKASKAMAAVEAASEDGNASDDSSSSTKEESKPKRKTTRRTKAKAKADADADVAAAEASGDAAATEETAAPKTKRTRKTKAAKALEQNLEDTAATQSSDDAAADSKTESTNEQPADVAAKDKVKGDSEEKAESEGKAEANSDDAKGESAAETKEADLESEDKSEA